MRWPECVLPSRLRIWTDILCGDLSTMNFPTLLLLRNIIQIKKYIRMLRKGRPAIMWISVMLMTTVICWMPTGGQTGLPFSGWTNFLPIPGRWDLDGISTTNIFWKGPVGWICWNWGLRSEIPETRTSMLILRWKFIPIIIITPILGESALSSIISEIRTWSGKKRWTGISVWI